MHTIDTLIAQLQAQKDAGLPGDTPVVVESMDNNRKAGFALRITGVRTVALAKTEFERGWQLCKVVSNRGVQSLLIG
ncbi:MAG: hypothetical protein O9327_02220 [Polaromonas sp.]|nr:hypothetical protein [Polaromonas sp.]